MTRTKGSKSKVKKMKVVEPIEVKEPRLVFQGEPIKTQSLLDPKVNSDVILIVRQPDGNYIGEMQINGKLKTTRQISPESVLQYLLYHDHE